MEEARKEARHQTLERMYITTGWNNGGIISSLTTLYWLTFGYFQDKKKYEIYWEVVDFLMEKENEE